MNKHARVEQRRGAIGARAPLAGVELGGTKCVCVLGDGPGAVRDRRVVATTTPDETLGSIAEVLAEWREGGSGFGALGIASFGPIGLDPRAAGHGRIGATAKPGWTGADVLGALAAGVPVALDTDVNAAAIAERRWGAGQGIDDFAYMTVGTGVGVGLIVGGRTTRGLGHGELGHIRVPRLAGDDAPSACPFHDDCVEGLASGSAIRARLGGRAVETVGPDDPVWEPVVAALARLCHAIACATAPRRIAIGGGVVTRQPHLVPRIAAALRESLNGYLALPTDEDYVVAPALGAEAGPLGALALAGTAEARGETA